MLHVLVLFLVKKIALLIAFYPFRVHENNPRKIYIKLEKENVSFICSY